MALETGLKRKKTEPLNKMTIFFFILESRSFFGNPPKNIWVLYWFVFCAEFISRARSFDPGLHFASNGAKHAKTPGERISPKYFARPFCIPSLAHLLLSNNNLWIPPFILAANDKSAFLAPAKTRLTSYELDMVINLNFAKNGWAKRS